MLNFDIHIRSTRCDRKPFGTRLTAAKNGEDGAAICAAVARLDLRYLRVDWNKKKLITCASNLCRYYVYLIIWHGVKIKSKVSRMNSMVSNPLYYVPEISKDCYLEKISNVKWATTWRKQHTEQFLCSNRVNITFSKKYIYIRLLWHLTRYSNKTIYGTYHCAMD